MSRAETTSTTRVFVTPHRRETLQLVLWESLIAAAGLALCLGSYAELAIFIVVGLLALRSQRRRTLHDAFASMPELPAGAEVESVPRSALRTALACWYLIALVVAGVVLRPLAAVGSGFCCGLAISGLISQARQASVERSHRWVLMRGVARSVVPSIRRRVDVYYRSLPGSE